VSRTVRTLLPLLVTLATVAPPVAVAAHRDAGTTSSRPAAVIPADNPQHAAFALGLTELQAAHVWVGGPF
jgi:hypothetical protein